MSIYNEILLNKKFEQTMPIEVERKFIPLFPETMHPYRETARPIEQTYLSRHDEPFSLRVREHIDESGTPQYTATLKDKGTIDVNGLTRIEIEAQISAELYAYYKSSSALALRKLRAEPLPGVFIDFHEDGSIIAEAENPDHWEHFAAEHGAPFVEVTGDRMADNEWRAHVEYLRSGYELPRIDELNATNIAADILQEHDEAEPLVVRIAGRSGSGKSTLVRQLGSSLATYGISPIVLSTDDYHRGTRWLTSYNNGEPWTAWDDAIVYDTKAMAADLYELKNGSPIPRRVFDFSTAEPLTDGTIEPSTVIIVEGIYAGSQGIAGPRELLYEMPTPLATCIGRRIIRDMQERPEFADPVKSLVYTLTHAEPAYRRQSAATGG